MGFKRRVGGAVATATKAPPVDFVIHQMKENRTKPGEPPVVVVGCGKEGSPYRGPNTTGLRTTVWRTDVTCPDCRVTSGVATLAYDPVVGDEPADDEGGLLDPIVAVTVIAVLVIGSLVAAIWTKPGQTAYYAWLGTATIVGIGGFIWLGIVAWLITGSEPGDDDE